MSAIRFTVSGEPKGKGRPRFRRQGNGIVTFTPADTVAYEHRVMLAAKAAMAGRPPMAGPVAVTIYAIFAVPKSATRSKRERMLSGEIHPRRIDIDNIEKAILDGAQRIVFEDDKDVVSLTAVKLYGETAGVTVHVRALSIADVAELREAA